MMEICINTGSKVLSMTFLAGSKSSNWNAGNEDLRQDERVMQLFRLVNNLLVADSESYKRRLNIRCYPIIPLAPNAGMTKWVQDSDTLNVLVRDYRDSRRILANIEYRLSANLHH
jgi:serine/threonine-protein kinase mTOR